MVAASDLGQGRPRAGGSNWITPQKIVAALRPALWRGHHLDGGTREARGTTR
jgi:hypothetical protein